MSYIDKINTVMDKLDVGKPVLSLSIGRRSIRVTEESWEPGLTDEDFYSHLVNDYCRRSFDSTAKQYKIDREYATTRMKDRTIQGIRDIFIKTSPAKAPKRTKIFKSFSIVVREKKHNDEFINAIFDISEYFYSIDSTESISSKNNEVHRKNIHQLLTLMEKRYGTKTG